MKLLSALSALLAFACLAVDARAQCLTPPTSEEASTEGPAVAGQTSADRLGRVVAPVHVNGRGPFRFIVDTGANRSVVSRALAERLGLATIGEGAVHSVHGVTQAPLVSVNSLTYNNLPVSSSTLPMLQGTMLAGEQGLLGVDGMQGRRLRLDFEAQCIEIIPARRAPTLGRGWTRLRGELRFGHLVVVPGRVDNVRVNVLIDTGSNISLANTALHAALAERVRYDRTAEGFARAYTAGDPVVLDTAIIAPNLDIGELRITDMLMFVGDFHVFSLWDFQNEPTVLVGMDVLSQARGLAIDYERGSVYFRLRTRGRVGARLEDDTMFRN